MNKKLFEKTYKQIREDFVSLLYAKWYNPPFTDNDINIIVTALTKEKLKEIIVINAGALYLFICDLQANDGDYETTLKESFDIIPGPDYDRRQVERDYGLYDGELDGKSIYQAVIEVEEEEGALDRYITEEE